MQSSRATLGLALTSILALASITQYGCRDAPTAPATATGPEAVPVSGVINAPGDSSAPEIIFLAPLGPRRHPRGELDTTLAPSVAICRLYGDQCGADTLAHFRSDSTVDSTYRVTMNERAFHLRWNVGDLPADTSIAYRVIVALGDTTVGFTDLKIVPDGYTPAPEDTLRFAFITERKRLRIRFQIFLPPVQLTVIAEPGVTGNFDSRTYTFRRGERVMYNFAADSGYNNALVTLDQNPIPRRGRLIMDDSHVLIASADRETKIRAGDEWILRDARALLKSSDKVASAQRLLQKLDEMEDTVDIIDRLHRVELTLLKRDADADAMPTLDRALDGHSFDAGGGISSPADTGGSGGNGGGGGGGGGGVIASARLVPLGSATQFRPAASIMAPTGTGEEPVTIAYVNGILTTPLGALFAAHYVAVAARAANWYARVPFDVKLIYNRSAMAKDASAEDRCVLDLGIKGDWLGLNSLPGELAKCLNSTEPKALALLTDYAEAGTELVSVLNQSLQSRPKDVDTVAAITTRLRDTGRHVVFVMHSQGNLIVQQALALLRKRGEYSQARDTTCIGGVALAAPTSKAWPISARHLHGLVVAGDAILMLGKNDFPQVSTPMSDSARAATSGSFGNRIMGLATAARLRWAIRLHSAIQSYLTQQPMRARIQDAIVSSYRGCAVGNVDVTPQILQLRTGESGNFDVALRDLEGNPLDGRRGITWTAESQSDWQRAVQLSSVGVASGHYVGGTSVSAHTRSASGNAGVTVDPAELNVMVTENLSAMWALVYKQDPPTPPAPQYIVPAVGWDGGSCTEKKTILSNGGIARFSKQCRGDYRVTTDSFPRATSYSAAFFEKGATAPAFIKEAPVPSLSGSIGGPQPTLDLLPGPVVLDRIVVTASDVAGHLLAEGQGCVHGCVGW